MPVYFIQEENNGFIKIGYSKSPMERLENIQTHNPRELTMLKMVSGDFEREAFIHYRWKKFRVRGEWFSPNSDLIEWINGLPNEFVYETYEVCKNISISLAITIEILDYARIIAMEENCSSWQQLIISTFLERYSKLYDFESNKRIFFNMTVEDKEKIIRDLSNYNQTKDKVTASFKIDRDILEKIKQLTRVLAVCIDKDIHYQKLIIATFLDKYPIRRINNGNTF